MKKMFEFKTKTIVATAIGAALFTLLMLYVKIPTGIPETDVQTCYGVGSFFAAMFGPIAGFLIGFIGHAISDATYGAPLVELGRIFRHRPVHHRSVLFQTEGRRRSFQF